MIPVQRANGGVHDGKRGKTAHKTTHRLNSEGVAREGTGDRGGGRTF